MGFVTTFKNSSDMVYSCLSLFTPVPLGRFPCSLILQSLEFTMLSASTRAGDCRSFKYSKEFKEVHAMNFILFYLALHLL